MTYADRLENNLKDKVDLLDLIYRCDELIVKNVDPDKSELEELDSYLEKMDSYTERLNALDTDTDEIIAYLQDHPGELRMIRNIQSDRIRSLLGSIEEKSRNLSAMELKVKEKTDNLIINKRQEIVNIRRQSRAVQNRYSTRNPLSVEEMTTFDTKN